MASGEWYELRVVGSVGTAAGSTAGVGIAVGENGRLCSLTLGCARRFESKQQAMDFLSTIRVSGDYQFQAVLCGSRVAA
ncbi:MAG: hypothetical protein HYY78_06760 [Betaproteobacteria bacterium]|nr:hypothetical protein [Betaproteobacteria bacterium]